MTSTEQNRPEPDLQIEVVESSGLLSELRRRFAFAQDQHAAQATEVSLNEADPGVLSDDDFAGVLALSSGRVIAALGYAKEPDRTMSVTVPLFGAGFSRPVQRKAFECLVRHIRKKTESLKLRGVHALVPISSSSEAEQRLVGWFADAGLAVVARIGGMLLEVRSTTEQTEVAADAASDAVSGLRSVDSITMADNLATGVRQYRLSGNYDVRLMQPEAILPATRRMTCSETSSSGVEVAREFLLHAESAEVRMMVQQVLKNSDDLPAEYRPEVDDILRMWIARNCMVLVVWPADDCVAAGCGKNHADVCAEDSTVLTAKPVAVVSLSLAEAATTNAAEAQSSASAVLDDTAALAIEYLGVRPDRRRQGIAGLLLDFIRSHASQINDRLRWNQLTGYQQADQPAEPGMQMSRASRCIQLSAFVDIGNFAAVNFYRRKGFTLLRQFDLLFHKTD